MRILIALFVSFAVALILYQSGAGTLASVAVIAVGVLAVFIMAAFNDPAPLQTRIVSEPAENAEAVILEAISEPVLFVVDGRVRVANDAAQVLLGAHIVGEDVRLAIRHPAAAERLAAGSPDDSIELVGLGGRDQRFELNVATTAPGRRIVHLIDRTGRHAVEQARIDFVANASHELRTPLAAILGFIETLSDDNAGGDPAVRARFLSIMGEEARRMQRLIDDLISLSRIEAEKHDLPTTTVALPALIKQVAGESRADLTLEIEDNVAPVAGESAQLSQVLHNLIGNAVKYGRADAAVTVALKDDGNSVRLSVADQGDGIAPEHLPRLTERFYRVDSGRSRALGGTGLGLAIVKHIVERHRGRLEIASKIGVGTTVSVVLPAAPATIVTETSPN